MALYQTKLSLVNIFNSKCFLNFRCMYLFLIYVLNVSQPKVRERERECINGEKSDEERVDEKTTD